ncbi:DUF427 domain-containing protein [Microbacterium sp. EYE_5]|uniref:DUF427 domain-containing protein n=1 Tax=unclassified Microbacterium TaxID=2609290 RepID=UPI0020058ED2|nr:MULTISPECIES: DUF427 domain-containing protein [unclassified Microbacterium]MCK6080775.1 DUF427 domain-containing protein [Microbacterium sp. EYE_382]MCK6086046.1 DUF427 domain-containing protein [Microbacterium sp. EYE_384]MCK6124456.1 DUF427 domain-containing protein [Microbacterium sp. EYE_80]MCK6127365.1 DUF427 domain-containing protein [Microbacterium sp. EYE_79]MCK6141730.1 DUF427 domain-containing protein [Microbacterium sp. EYE_39]
MKATIGDTVIAEASDDEIIRIEGNPYFPPSSIADGVLVESPTPYTCPWKGVCQYFHIEAGDDSLKDGAWSYPDPYPTAFDRVGKDFSGYVAFSPGVTVSS